MLQTIQDGLHTYTVDTGASWNQDAMMHNDAEDDEIGDAYR